MIVATALTGPHRTHDYRALEWCSQSEAPLLRLAGTFPLMDSALIRASAGPA